MAVNTVHSFMNTCSRSLFTTAVHTFVEGPAAEPAAPEKKPASERPAREEVVAVMGGGADGVGGGGVGVLGGGGGFVAISARIRLASIGKRAGMCSKGPRIFFCCNPLSTLEVLEVDILWPRWVARIGVTRATEACFLTADRQCTELQPLLRLPRLPVVADGGCSPYF